MMPRKKYNVFGRKTNPKTNRTKCKTTTSQSTPKSPQNPPNKINRIQGSENKSLMLKKTVPKELQKFNKTKNKRSNP